MITASVKMFDQFDRVTEHVERTARAAVQDAAEEGARVAASIASRRRKTGTMAQMQVISAAGGVDGFTAGFKSKATKRGSFYAGYQSRGTLASRKARLKASTLKRRSSPSGEKRFAKVAGRQGITPLGFMEAGRAAGRARLRSRVARGI